MLKIPFLYMVQISHGSSLDEVAWLYSMYVDSETLYRDYNETDMSFRKRLFDQYKKDFCEIEY